MNNRFGPRLEQKKTVLETTLLYSKNKAAKKGKIRSKMLPSSSETTVTASENGHFLHWQSKMRSKTQPFISQRREIQSNEIVNECRHHQ